MCSSSLEIFQIFWDKTQKQFEDVTSGPGEIVLNVSHYFLNLTDQTIKEHLRQYSIALYEVWILPGDRWS